MNSTVKIMLFITPLFLFGCVTAPAFQPTETSTAIPTSSPFPTETATPTNTPSPTEPPLVSFASKVRPIILSRCVVCHGGTHGTEEGLNMLTYKFLMSGSDNGPVIIPFDAEGSKLVELISTQEMPKRGPKLTPSQVQTIVDWINQGALDN